jgi:hypothetical protein
MKKNNLWWILLILIIGIVLYLYLSSKPSPIVSGTTVIYPVEFPDEAVSGINFPTDSNTINGWINDTSFVPNHYDSLSIYTHAWGIWAGLTAETKQRIDPLERPLRIYETWMGLNEVRDYIIQGKEINTKSILDRGRAPLTRPTQFAHAGHLEKSVNLVSKQSTFGAPATGFWVTVSYNPAQAQSAAKNKIFKQSVINSYYNKGKIGSIPSFPNNSIMIKPTYLVYSSKDDMLQMPVWIDAPNPPDSLNVFGPDQFPLCVYVDTKNKQDKNKKITPVLATSTNKTAIKNATCNLSDFISFKVDAKTAKFMNQQDSIQGLNGNGAAKAGDLAVLVAMHVSTKEVSNWTWQTFYWAPTPSNPGSPSSKLAANTITKEVKGAARHYALNAAYVMTTPNNSNNAGAGSMFGYNPYLEGGFGPATFNITNNYNSSFKYGMQSNCMSCHALAVPSNHTGYTTDQPINLNDPVFFNSEVKLDFAWSIQTALIKDAVPYWKKPKK